MTECASDCPDSLDPRVQIELERLNTATDEINKLEVELDEARLIFRQQVVESNLKTQQLTRKLGASIDKSRPYYEARFRANVAMQEMRVAAVQYEKANSAHSAAREMVYLAEQGLCRLCEEGGASGGGKSAGVSLDPAWQEMLNHATSRVNQAEAERATAGAFHRATAAQHRTAVQAAQNLQNSLKRQIAKSRPYFEEKARSNAHLDTQKKKIQSLERDVANVKLAYSQALRNLERISDEIHRNRGKRARISRVDHNGTQPEGEAENDDAIKTEKNAKPLEKKPIVNGASKPTTNGVEPWKSDTIREWLENQNSDHQSSQKSPLALRPNTLPHGFKDKYDDLLTPHNPNPHKQQQTTTPSQPEAKDADNWTEINLEYSSPEEISFERCSKFGTMENFKIPYERMDAELVSQQTSPEDEQRKQPTIEKIINSKVSAGSPRRIIKGKLVTQNSLPQTAEPPEFTRIGASSFRSKLKPDISTWISRSSAKTDDELQYSPTRRQSFDVILNDTGEKVKEIFNQGVQMFSISSLTERRNSEPRAAEKLSPQKSEDAAADGSKTQGYRSALKKMPSPLDKTLSYLNVYNETSVAADDQGSDTDSLASVEMLTDDQIHSLMLDGQLESICNQMLSLNTVEDQTIEEETKS